ncbi:MAG TPA: cyclic pyranopterin monophosphate synthase MoaC [Candidatus Limnocylindrales bacterium]|nr:cyclic pyranopterin monophosphate synthase MoaC [Candidatus Limnocylindrales bacterium]
MNAARLSHLDAAGRAGMVDVSAKPLTLREAVARGAVRMTKEALRVVTTGTSRKGDVLTTARIAGIMGAKATSALIPMTHPLPLTLVELRCTPDAALPGIRIESRVRCQAPTGAEMEALTAVAVAALTIVDMVKSADRWMTIEQVELVHKSGGKSGRLDRPTKPRRASARTRPSAPRRSP